MLHPSTQDPLPPHWVPSLPHSAWPGGAANPQGMVEDALRWSICASAGEHPFIKFCVWEVIYLVSYDFVFPCVNIWEAQLMFCAQPRQLQPSAQPCHPPSPHHANVKGETQRKPPS